MAVSAPNDKRFRRAHVKPGRKRNRFAFSPRRAAILAAIAAVALFAGYRSIELLVSAEALTVTRITVSGNARLSKGEVLALLDGLAAQLPDGSALATSFATERERLLAEPLNFP